MGDLSIKTVVIPAEIQNQATSVNSHMAAISPPAGKTPQAAYLTNSTTNGGGKVPQRNINNSTVISNQQQSSNNSDVAMRELINAANSHSGENNDVVMQLLEQIANTAAHGGITAEKSLTELNTLAAQNPQVGSGGHVDVGFGDGPHGVGNGDPDTDLPHYSGYDPFIFGWGTSIFANIYAALVVMESVAVYVSNCQLAQIQRNTQLARELQDWSNKMDHLIAEVTKQGDKGSAPLPPDLIKYLREHNIKIEGMSIDDFIKKYGDDKGNLDLGSLKSVKGAIDNEVNRATDSMNTGQLVLSKMNQTVSALITEMSTMITKWGSLISMLAQEIGGR